MPAHRHSLLREGLLTGVIGGAVLAVWYLIFDVAAGQPYQTAAALGQFLFRGHFTPVEGGFGSRVTVASTVFYIVFFALIGLGLVQLAHLASRNRAMRMGVWLGLVLSFCFYTIVTVVVASATGQALPLWRAVAGSMLSTVAMAAFLLRIHPHLTSGSEPLGAEGLAPPHPPG
jgi:hypothetical protein